MMKKFTTLLEELNEYQKSYVNHSLGGIDYDPTEKHKEMFDSYEGTPIKQDNDRLIFKQDLSEPHVNPEIKIHLKTHGWDIHDYRAGLASRTTIDREGNHKLEVRKIGKVLQQTGGDKVIHSMKTDRLIKGSDGKPLIGENGRMQSERVPQSLLHFYNTDPVRDSTKSEHNIIISRDKEDIAGMTSGRTWEKSSCMRLPDDHNCSGGVHHDKIKNDLNHGTLVAYAVKKGDDNIESPSGRVLIKQYNSDDKENPHTIYRTEYKTYGNVPEGFKDQIESIMKKHYPEKTGISYDLAHSLYSDGRQSIEPLKTGLYNYNGARTHYNENGQLHDYLDEHGVKQPAMKYDDDNYTHYKNGKIHNEDGVAKRVDVVNSHYINGELHREGDLPAVYTDDGKHKEYYVGGIRHRFGNKPAVIKTYLREKETQYYHAGMLHDPDENIPSNVSENQWSKVVEYRKKHRLNSPNNNTPAHKYTKLNHLGETVHVDEEYRIDGKLHRDDDLPAAIQTHLIDKKITKKWYKDGNEHRENGKPIKETTDFNGNVLYHQWNDRDGTDKPAEIEYNGSNRSEHYHDGNGNFSKTSYHTKDGIVHLYKNHNKVLVGGNAVQFGNLYKDEPTDTIIKSGDNIHIIDHANKTIKTIDKNGNTFVSHDVKPLLTQHGDHLMINNKAYIDKLTHIADNSNKTPSTAIDENLMHSIGLNLNTDGIRFKGNDGHVINDLEKRIT